MIKRVSDVSQQYPFLSLLGLGFLVNLYIQAMSWRINHMIDPLTRQFYQNLFICLLCALVALAAVMFALVCKTTASDRELADLPESDRARRKLWYNVIVPLLMVAVIIGDVAVVASLRW